MPKVERERKFLVNGDGWRGQGERQRIRQAYLSTDPDRNVRVRSIEDRAVITIKGRSHGPVRPELEYDIPVEDVDQLMAMAKGHVIEKTRHRVEHAGFTWEVDEFAGENAGLVLAEIEVEDPDELERAVSERPDWVGREVTEDHRYANSSLAERPWATWR